MTLPTAQDIDPEDSLDGGIACQHFLGKSLGGAQALFRENPLYYVEDLIWMGPVGFRFYVLALISHLQSEAAVGDAELIDRWVGLLEFRLEQEAAELMPVAFQLAGACGYVAEHRERFGLEPEMYGDLPPRCQELQQIFWRLAILDSGAGAPGIRPEI